jgi:XRE family transcriptional regulator, aerobic/anaerobic benzoate catabolism transcriptional regulator
MHYYAVMLAHFDSETITTERASQIQESEFLAFLGKRVRAARSLRGMTRKIAAQEADVSERHLAQIEAGEGNVSILLLRRIAAALNVSLVELVSFDAEEPTGKELIRRLLERLPANRLEEVLFRLTRDFGAEEKSRQKKIALIGLRGAGKSTLGSRLSHNLGIPFIELDREIEKEAGMPVAEIFSFYAQSGYRSIEKRTLDRVLREHERAVFSIGGGVVSEKETYHDLLSHCFTIWIQAQPEEHMARVIAQGDFRAMEGNDQAMEDLRRILDAREPLYREADMYLDTSGESADQSFAKLKAALEARFQDRGMP